MKGLTQPQRRVLEACEGGGELVYMNHVHAGEACVLNDKQVPIVTFRALRRRGSSKVMVL